MKGQGLALTTCRYIFSISISVYNKWMFKEDKGDGKTENIFPYPLFTTCLHMVVQFSLASLVLFFIPSFRPRHDSLNPHAPGHVLTRQEALDSKKPLMTKWFYFSRIGPCGAATGMDIGLGNTSLRFITLTFFSKWNTEGINQEHQTNTTSSNVQILRPWLCPPFRISFPS